VIAVATRVFFGPADAHNMEPMMEPFLDAALRLRDYDGSKSNVMIAVDPFRDSAGVEDWVRSAYDGLTDTFPVTPWDRGLGPINQFIRKARRAGADKLLMCSAEFPPAQSTVNDLLAAFEVSKNTIVAGALFASQDVPSGEHAVQTSYEHNRGPRNTFALWSVNALSFGLPSFATSNPDDASWGMEEVSMAAMAKRVPGFKDGQVVLVRPKDGSLDWNQTHWSEDRRKRHALKFGPQGAEATMHQHQCQWLQEMGLEIPKVLFAPSVESLVYACK
jgi:hypothetical protein